MSEVLLALVVFTMLRVSLHVFLRPSLSTLVASLLQLHHETLTPEDVWRSPIVLVAKNMGLSETCMLGSSLEARCSVVKVQDWFVSNALELEYEICSIVTVFNYLVPDRHLRALLFRTTLRHLYNAFDTIKFLGLLMKSASSGAVQHRCFRPNPIVV